MSNESLEFEPANHIKLDLFPAEIYQTADTGEEELVAKDCRLIVTDAHIYAIIQDVHTGLQFALKEELVDFERIPGTGFRIAGAHLDYRAVRSGGCGCGARLRGMRFLTGVPHISRIPTPKK